ncbi:DNA-binding protein [Xaviernesmea oryzae]|uniref:DNA-binding protein n=1 Tax=Xaviernesmea oryzae TaxID=464029 RepID=A0A1Q9AV22_9HYPH|nr:DNA-binding protein [Xaviernesmea oryzae]
MDGKTEGNGRLCIVTRQSLPADDLIRFVAAPDGSVVPDIKRRLPGRGCWVTARRSMIDQAVKRKLFARGLKAQVKADADLGETVDRLLAADLAGMINLARKAGQFTTGASKVEQAVRGQAALAVFHATDAAADGVRKISQARKAMSFVTDNGSEVPAFRFFTAEEGDTLFGSNSFIHAAALAGQAGEGVVKRATMLDMYRDTVAMGTSRQLTP